MYDQYAYYSLSKSATGSVVANRRVLFSRFTKVQANCTSTLPNRDWSRVELHTLVDKKLKVGVTDGT